MASPVKDAKAHHQGRGFTQVHGRGRGHLVSRKPGTNQYAITTQVGGRGWHRGNGPYDASHEVDTAWQVGSGAWEYEMTLGDPFQAYIDTTQRTYRYEDMASGEWVDLTVNAIEWVNDTGDSENAATLAAPVVTVNDDTISFSGLFGVGSNLDVQAQTARLKKVLTLDNDAVLSTPTLSGAVSLSYSLRFQRSSGVSIWVDGVQWNEKANNPQLTAAEVEFKNSAGASLFAFRVPYAEDVNEARQDGTMYLKKSGANLFVEVRIPHAWMASAVYPIKIDPTIDSDIQAGADDGEARSGGSSWIAGDNTVSIGFHTVGSIQQRHGGFRFSSGISGLSGATISVSYFNPYINADNSSVTSDIYAEDAAAPGQVSSYADFTGRTKTTASVVQDGAWGGTGYQQSNSLNTVIQELADSYDPSVIHVMIFSDNTGSTNAWTIPGIEGWTGTRLAKLHIEYTAAASGNPWYAYAQQ